MQILSNSVPSVQAILPLGFGGNILPTPHRGYIHLYRLGTYNWRFISITAVDILKWMSGWITLMYAISWLKKHPRFHLHFTPTSSSWLNQVERWFGEITRKRIRRGVFKSVPELVNSIDNFIKLDNQNPKPFVWTKTVQTILEKIARCKEATVTLR